MVPGNVNFACAKRFCIWNYMHPDSPARGRTWAEVTLEMEGGGVGGGRTEQMEKLELPPLQNFYENIVVRDSWEKRTGLFVVRNRITKAVSPDIVWTVFQGKRKRN